MAGCTQYRIFLPAKLDADDGQTNSILFDLGICLAVERRTEPRVKLTGNASSRLNQHHL